MTDHAVTDPAIIEAAARALLVAITEEYSGSDLVAVIAAFSRIEAAALEEAAKVAEAHKLGDNAMLTGTSIWAVHEGACIEIAAAVRALKEQP